MDTLEMTRLVEDKYPQLYARLAAVARNHSAALVGDVEDAIQDAFVLLYERWDALCTHENLAGWLFLTAHNNLMNRYRVMKGRAKIVPMSLDEDGGAQASDALAAQRQGQQEREADVYEELLDRVKDQIDPESYQFLLEYFSSETTAKAMAQKYGVSEASIWMRRSRLVKKAKSALFHMMVLGIIAAMDEAGGPRAARLSVKDARLILNELLQLPSDVIDMRLVDICLTVISGGSIYALRGNVRRAVKRVLNRIAQKEAPKRRLTRRALLIAAIVAVLLAAATVATVYRSEILFSFFGYEMTPPKEAEEAVVYDAASCTQEGLTLKFDEYVMDAGALCVRWSVTSQRDDAVFYVIRHNIEGSDALVNMRGRGLFGGVSRDIGDGQMVMLGGKVGEMAVPRTHQSSLDMSFADWTLDEPVTLTVTIQAYTTHLTPWLHDDGDDGYNDVIITEGSELARQLSENRQIPVNLGGQGYLLHDPAFIEAQKKLVSAIPRPTAEDYNDDREGWDAYEEALNEAYWEAYDASGLLQPLATLTAAITIDPETVNFSRGVRMVTPLTLDMSDYTVQIDQMAFCPGSVSPTGVVSLYPKEGAREDVVLVVTDQDYRLIPWSGYAAESFVYMTYEGEPYPYTTWSGGPTGSLPTQINLALLPRSALAGYDVGDLKVYFCDENNTGSLKALYDGADPRDVKTIQLPTTDPELLAVKPTSLPYGANLKFSDHTVDIYEMIFKPGATWLCFTADIRPLEGAREDMVLVVADEDYRLIEWGPYAAKNFKPSWSTIPGANIYVYGGPARSVPTTIHLALVPRTALEGCDVGEWPIYFCDEGNTGSLKPLFDATDPRDVATLDLT